MASHQSPFEEEEPEYLPYPATKLIIAQYWHCSRDPPFWGYLIVGTFFDQHNNIVWSTEIFAFQRDTRGDRRHGNDEGGQFVELSDSGESLCFVLMRGGYSLPVSPRFVMHGKDI